MVAVDDTGTRCPSPWFRPPTGSATGTRPRWPASRPEDRFRRLDFGLATDRRVTPVSYGAGVAAGTTLARMANKTAARSGAHDQAANDQVASPARPAGPAAPRRKPPVKKGAVAAGRRRIGGWPAARATWLLVARGAGVHGTVGRPGPRHRARAPQGRHRAGPAGAGRGHRRGVVVRRRPAGGSVDRPGLRTFVGGAVILLPLLIAAVALLLLCAPEPNPEDRPAWCWGPDDRAAGARPVAPVDRVAHRARRASRPAASSVCDRRPALRRPDRLDRHPLLIGARCCSECC